MQEGFTQAPKTEGPGRHTAWLATVHPDGRPHVMPIGVLFVDNAFYFNTGPKTRKARNIARNPSSVMTIATDDFDIVVQGPAKRITDPRRLQRIADAFKRAGGRGRACGSGGVRDQREAAAGIGRRALASRPDRHRRPHGARRRGNYRDAPGRSGTRPPACCMPMRWRYSKRCRTCAGSVLTICWFSSASRRTPPSRRS